MLGIVYWSQNFVFIVRRFGQILFLRTLIKIADRFLTRQKKTAGMYFSAANTARKGCLQALATASIARLIIKLVMAKRAGRFTHHYQWLKSAVTSNSHCAAALGTLEILQTPLTRPTRIAVRNENMKR